MSTMDTLSTFLQITCAIIAHMLLPTSSGQLTVDWTTLLFLKAGTTENPAALWDTPASSYSSGTNKSVYQLINNGSVAYRNNLIDSWATSGMQKIRVSYRNADGRILYSALFNASGKSQNNWFHISQMQDPKEVKECDRNIDHNSYSAQFSFGDSTLGVSRYRAATIRMMDGNSAFIVSSSEQPNFLPMTPYPENSSCQFSGDVSNPLLINITVSNLTRTHCAAVCRERNKPYAAVHGTLCGCLMVKPSTSVVDGCNISCPGAPTETCGGQTEYTGYIRFNLVNTDINAALFDQPLKNGELFNVTGSIKKNFMPMQMLYALNVTSPITFASELQFDVLITIADTVCNENNTSNFTKLRTVTLINETQFFSLQLEPIVVKCLSIQVFNTNSLTPYTDAVNFVPVVLADHLFVRAKFLTIEAGWYTVEVNETQNIVGSNLCECQCWVYNMLYGNTPFDNLTYGEIEKALENITRKIQEELSVNKSELSSTIRKLTSAKDDRVTAVAMGYTLGVAMLVTTLGAILLADLPKVINGFNILRKSLRSRFRPQKSTQSSN
ncbi:uncharacterized protein LOC127851004 [Dreissena polymorpha]|uniref:WSC domain-containing protein n=1 Tax=Dreissena polymorpha TaxID=45954 RepID=A0A9D4S526_DREPO|nr:uncharacterized protein LOC127851004 [Dreissena polymorpha]KAH3890207.1 hypothetical protein DPMN_014279 [Dreissena polymorpha]